MPSHVSHMLFAQESWSAAGLPDRVAGSSFLILGAQGPDFFYHNQRRKPSGLTYGSLMHRHGYGKVVSHMAAWGWKNDLGLESWAGQWAVGFATHAILDRHTHPYINYFSGWVAAGDPHTQKYRSMHPFLERLIDVALLEHLRGIHPNDLDFAGSADCGEVPPESWLDLMSNALASSYNVAAGDESLRERLQSAYLDTAGFYRFTNLVDTEYLRGGLSREDRGEIGKRWLSIVHPLEIPPGIDVLNLEEKEWVHPCDDTQTSRDSFLQLYSRALGESVPVVRTIAEAWNDTGTSQDKRRERIEAAVGNWNLSDGRMTERPCAKKFADPFPLSEAQKEIRDQIRSGSI